MPEQYEQERSEEMGRRVTDCTPQGCAPVVSNQTSLKLTNTKLNWVLTLLTIFGTVGCALLGTQSYQIPVLRAEMVAGDTALKERLSSIEAWQKSANGKMEDNQAAITELESSVYVNQRAIKQVARPINKTIRTQEYYVVPAKQPPAAQNEIWRR